MLKSEYKLGSMRLIDSMKSLRDCGIQQSDPEPGGGGNAGLPTGEFADRKVCVTGWFRGRVFAGTAGILLLATTVFGATNTTNTANLATNAPFSPSEQPMPETSRGLYNAGTAKLAEGRLDDAETLLRSALDKQDQRIQPHALYNLGYTRFAQGKAELKKGPSANSAGFRGSAANQAADRAIQQAEAALEGTDLRKMVAAYLRGRGARRELAAATEAVRQAMEAHGETLRTWRRAVGDFQSAAELDPADTNAARNAQIVEQAIARLVDSLQRMQQMAMAAGGKSTRLNELMQQLRGRIPKEMMPPGAAGDDQMDALMEAMRGMKEAPSRGGEQMELRLSPEEAGQLLDSIRLDGNRPLPLDEGQRGQPRERSGRTW